MTLLVTLMPRCCSSAIQSLVAWRAARRALTDPARWMAPPYSRSFSVSVVFAGVRMRDDGKRSARCNLGCQAFSKLGVGGAHGSCTGLAVAGSAMAWPPRRASRTWPNAQRLQAASNQTSCAAM